MEHKRTQKSTHTRPYDKQRTQASQSSRVVKRRSEQDQDEEGNFKIKQEARDEYTDTKGDVTDPSHKKHNYRPRSRMAEERGRR